MRAAKGGFTLKRVSFTLSGADNGAPTGSSQWSIRAFVA
jgi:hypothetical protein